MQNAEIEGSEYDKRAIEEGVMAISNTTIKTKVEGLKRLYDFMESFDKDPEDKLFEIDEKPETVGNGHWSAGYKQVISRIKYGYGDIYANDYSKDGCKCQRKCIYVS